MPDQPPLSRPVALVLGAAVWADGPSPTLRRRSLHAAAAFHAGRVSHLIACGGMGRHPPTEADAIRAILLHAGVPAHAISLEDGSTNTMENIANALPMLQRLSTRSVLIVTDGYHAPRARLIARKLGLQAQSTSPAPTGMRRGQWLRYVLREIPAYFVALIMPQR